MTPDASDGDTEPSVRRRALLAAAAAGSVGAAAGCVSDDDNGGGGGGGGDDGPPDFPWSNADLEDMEPYHRFILESLHYQNQQLSDGGGD